MNQVTEGNRTIPAPALPTACSEAIARLTDEARGLHAQRVANIAEADRRNAANNEIANRLAQIESEIRVAVWNGDQPC